MKLLTLAISILAFFAAGLFGGQDTPADAERPATGNYVSLDKTSTGENVLLVKYPWRVHAKASIEVRLVADKKDFNVRAKPLRFMANDFNAETAKRVYRVQDEALTRPSSEKIETGGLKWEIVGHSNHLGRGAVWIVNQQEKDSPAPGVAAVFCKLDPWSIDDRTLILDLPRESFDKPGKMYIWFLRGAQIVWQNEAQWPGRK